MVRTHGDDESEQRVIDDVQRVGWHLVGVEGDSEGPAFVYSVGFQHSFGQPEIIIFGLNDTSTMAQIVNNIGDEIRNGSSFDDWYESDQVLNDYCCMFRNVEREYYPEYLGYAMWFYEGRDFSALQCVWPDKDGNYPWEPECSPELNEQQPLLSKGIGWPFHEGKNRAVFTTRQVLEGGYPVVLVTHDHEGNWQFLCGTTDDPKDGRLVGMATVIEKNPTILELVDLPVGWQAIRESTDRPWQRMRI